MNLHRLRRGSLVMVTWGSLLLGSIEGVAAQTAGQAGPAPVAYSFDELRVHIQPGATIIVTDSAGHEVNGELTDLSDTFLDVLVSGKSKTFTQAEVERIQRRQRDPLWNGFLIGAAAGTAPAIYWLIADPNECGNSICLDDLAIGVLISAPIGLAIDAAIRSTVVVYRGPSKSSKTTLTLAPIVANRRKGVGLTMSF